MLHGDVPHYGYIAAQKRHPTEELVPMTDVMHEADFAHIAPRCARPGCTSVAAGGLSGLCDGCSESLRNAPIESPVITATYVTIGRNVGSEPMSDRDWKAFQSRVDDAMACLIDGLETITYHHGQGVWQGVTEESVIITAIHTGEVNPVLADWLSTAAAIYGQDAIALVSAPSILVPAKS